MKKFGRKTTLNLRYGSDKGSHSVVPDWKGYDFMEIAEKKETNADRIRNMSDEELADFLDVVGKDGISSQYSPPCDCCFDNECEFCWKEWLQSEAE